MLRPGRPTDLPAVIELWRQEVRDGRRDAMPRQSHLDGLATRFDWEARSRVAEGDGREMAGVVLVASYPSVQGALAQIDAATGPDDGTLRAELTRWALGLSRASGAVAAMSWVARGQSAPLRELGLQMVRPWWRMDRSLETSLPEPEPVEGYELLAGPSVAAGAWAEVHNLSFADHWRFSMRAEEELMAGKAPELSLMVVTAQDRGPAAVTLGQVETHDEDRRPQPFGLVSSVGTVPAHRRRGLARWLVAEIMQRLRSAGARHASLYVDGWNRTRAYEVYEKLGFGVAFEAEVWEATFP